MGQEILACETVGITVTLPKPMTSSAKAAGRFGKQDFVYVVADDVYRCPAVNDKPSGCINLNHSPRLVTKIDLYRQLAHILPQGDDGLSWALS